MATKEPMHRIRLGNIRAAIWSNQTEDQRHWFNVTIARRYRSGDVWHDATSFAREDLPVVAQIAHMAYSFIWQQQAGQETAEE